ncbi:MAG: hypothetical protein KDA28_03250, partial [Phycisphaerales bacterium]|nr:hypothetical protein [Phycisphaerales bacterium]
MRSSIGWMAAGLIAAAGTSAMAQGEYIFRDERGNITQPRGDHSVARMWNEVLLDGIRTDLARPTVHARNLFHISIAMWDAWAAYDTQADTYINHERQTAVDVKAAREEAVSYAAFRMIEHRFANSPGSVQVLGECADLMAQLGYDTNFTDTVGDTPAALGNRIAATIIAWGLTDGSNEANGYANLFYEPINPPLLPDFPGNPDIIDVNRWQPLALDFFVDQGGNVIIGGYPDFLSPEWGQVDAFALRDQDLTVYNRDGFDYKVFHDPGAPPMFGAEGDEYYRWGFEMVAVWSSHLDPADGVLMDISPASLGNSPLPEVDEWATYYDFYNGSDWSQG